MICRAIPGLALLAVFLSTAPARADEIRLKDGTKIIGTIVGFENDSFRVETSYGFALVQKDKVADISISAPKKELDPKAKSSAPAPPAPVATPAVVPAIAKKSVSSADVTSLANASAPELPAAGPNPSAGAAGSGGSASAAKSDPAMPRAKPLVPAPSSPSPSSPSALPPPLAPVPAPPPEPPVIRDEVRGNLYVNLTYGFQMYKPPSWDLIPAARKALPDAVAALGTYDQTTLLVIGRAHSKDSLEAHAAATGKALTDAYDNYRVISNKHVSIAGFPAIEQRSRGTADGRDWSVILLTFLKGNDAFTLLGMTWADSDLIQVQENVISKTVNSLTFAAQ
ncbi:MAG: hypothetical protein ABSA96_07925 [Candidatus Acidiferrales bacterium]|jgi:hypothetical protein